MRNIITRTFDISHDSKNVIDLIIKTDNYIYPPMVSIDECEGIAFFQHCFEDEKSLFGRNNIIVAEIDHEIAGIVIAFAWENHMRLCDQNSIAKNANAANISFCDTHYFKPLLEEYSLKPDVIYISNVCVHEKFRNQGVGNALLRYLLEQNGNIDFELDVLCDNSAAIHLYSKFGFEILFSEHAFSFYPVEGLKSYRMKLVR